MDQVTQLMFAQLVGAQEQIHMACNDASVTCPTDMRYQQEWEGLRDFIDTSVENIRAAISLVHYTPAEVHGMMGGVMNSLVPVGNALLEGYLTDLANCTECGPNPCPLARRAQEALQVRQWIIEGK